MPNPLLQAEVQAFIREKSDAGWSTQYAFEKHPFTSLSTSELLQQIQGRARALKKIPLWAETTNILYPAPLSMEQCSSQETALYKAQWLKSDTVLDATGGFGVDDYYFALDSESLTYCEMQAELADIVQHNFTTLGLTNTHVHIGDSTSYLKETTESFDLIYVDPARRHDTKGKVFRLEDCAPDVIELQSLYFKKAKRVALKLSPLMDIHLLEQQLSGIHSIRTITYNGELKELLVLLERDYTGEITYTASWHHGETWHEFSYQKNTASSPIAYGILPQYVYEPHPGLMKLGAWEEICTRYPVVKGEKNSHLFYASSVLTDFPGRGFAIRAIVPYSKKALQAHGLPDKANVSVRNFPESVDVLRKKWKIKDGGSDYLFFTTGPQQEKLVLFCQKIIA